MHGRHRPSPRPSAASTSGACGSPRSTSAATRRRPRSCSNAIAEAPAWFDDLSREVPAVDAGADRRRPGRHHLHRSARSSSGWPTYDRDLIHHFPLTRAAIEDVFRTLATERLADRIHNPGLEEARADVIVGGLCVLVAFVRTLGIDELLVSESDILDGLVASLRPRVPPMDGDVASAGGRVGHDAGRPLRQRARLRRPRRAARRGRSTTRCGSGTPSSSTSASRSRRPTTQVLDDSDGIPWATLVHRRPHQPGRRLRRPVGRTRRPTPTRSCGRARRAPPARGPTPQLRAEADGLARLLEQRGVAAGDAVGIFLPMLPETVAAVLAVAKLGAVFVPVFSGLRRRGGRASASRTPAPRR